ncbi:DUF1490 family protein [Streptomyces sp. NPDC012888]|uniref:DUF1490 family protein n=1 Tax=Streptomyces sp. NPDC012888 TaxID=3364855 RepID=UPI0036D093E3
MTSGGGIPLARSSSSSVSPRFLSGEARKTSKPRTPHPGHVAESRDLTHPTGPSKRAPRSARHPGRGTRTAPWARVRTGEEARLKAGDMLAEARTSLGEEVPPPAAVKVDHDDHGHEH